MQTRNTAPRAVGHVKENVHSFNRDVVEGSGYVYTTNQRYSSRVANLRLTRATMALIPPDVRTILDVGCGDGTFTQEIKDYFPRAGVTGFDPAEAAVRRAERLYPACRFLVGNAEDASTLPAPGAGFDVAVIRGVLHHMAEPHLAVVNMAPIARRLIIIEPNGNNPVLKMIEKRSAYHREHEERSFPPSLLRSWCREAGYRVVSLRYVGFVPFFFPTLPAKLIYACQPFLERLPVVTHFLGACSVILCEREVHSG
jgi:SAM-dependent methyltransferase